MSPEEKAYLEKKLETVSQAGAAFSNPNSAVYRQREVLEKRLAGEPISTQEAAYTARSLRPTVKEVMDRTGLSFNEAGAITGRINALEQESLKKGQNQRLLVDYGALRTSEAFQEDPAAALSEAGRQLAAALQPYRSGAGKTPVGSSGILQLRESVETSGQRKGQDDPFLRAYIVNPDSGVLENLTGVSPEEMTQAIRSRGYQLSQGDIDSIRQQYLDYYGGEVPSGSAGTLLSVLDRIDPIEYDRPDVGNVIMGKGVAGGPMQSGYNYLGEDPVPYISMDDYFSGQQGAVVQSTPAEDLMSSSMIYDSSSAAAAAPVAPVTALDSGSAVSTVANAFPVVTQQPSPSPSPSLAPMADSLETYYGNLYNLNPYYQYYGDPYMFESVFDSGVYDPSGTGE